MNVLIACEYSAVVRDAFRARGHNAWSCDLLPCEGDVKWHLQGDALVAAKCLRWDLMIAHPPCTYLCSSGLHWNSKTPGRAELTKQALKFVQDLLNCDIPKIALENPIGRIGTAIRKADQYVQPYEYGHDASKKTGLWLKGLPLLEPTKMIAPRFVCCGETLPEGVGKYGCPYCQGDKKPKMRWANQTNSGQNKLGPSNDRWKIRSKTYQGIADAMAEQWGHS